MQLSRSSWLFLVTSVVVWLFLFWPFLIGQSCFGYRDTAHLYYPLFEWIQDQWSRGEIPLWNPLDDFGQPLVGDGVSSIFYPLKTIFFLTALPYPVRFGFYVSVHALIAAWGAYFLARRMRISPAASVLAAVGFALSGAVLFQTCNVIYLIGAAWIPWALASGWKSIRTTNFRDRVWCGVFIALMILGGDPQSAYHVLLILGASAIFATRRVRRAKLGLARLAPIARWSVIALIAAGLAAVQWLPSWQWQQRSLRANPETPRSVWESTGALLSGRGFHADHWLSSPIGDTHHDHIYQFSQPPWSLIELIWPNVSGREFPVFRRWTSGIPSADRIWTPSLYFGLVIVLLAVCGARLCGRSKKAVRLTWLTIVFGLGSFGWYGLGWIAREIGGMLQFAGFEQTPSPLFGVYWSMVTLLPGYAMFRYPAKLFVVATLGASLLAGYQLTRLNRQRSGTIGWLALGVFAASAALLGASYEPGISALFPQIQANPTFGPFSVRGALRDLQLALVHALIVSSLLWFILRARSVGLGAKRVPTGWIVVLAVVELTIANVGLIVGVPANVLTTSSGASLLENPESQQRPLRVRRFPFTEGQPIAWASVESPQRLEEVIQFERGSLHPKYHLAHGIDLIGSFHAIEPLDLQWFTRVVGTRYDPALAIDFRIRSKLTALDATLDENVSEYAWLEPVIAAPRVIFVNDWTPPQFSRTTRLRADQKREFIAAVQADLTILNLAEDRVPSVTPRPATDRANHFDDMATTAIVSETANQVAVHVDCPSAGWLILKDYWDAGWRAEIRDGQMGTLVTVLPERFCGLFRAIKLPQAGEFDVRFVYRPASFLWGALASLATLLAVAGAAVGRRFSKSAISMSYSGKSQFKC